MSEIPDPEIDALLNAFDLDEEQWKQLEANPAFRESMKAAWLVFKPLVTAGLEAGIQIGAAAIPGGPAVLAAAKLFGSVCEKFILKYVEQKVGP